MFDDCHVSLNKTGYFSYIAHFLLKMSNKRPHLARKTGGNITRFGD